MSLPSIFSSHFYNLCNALESILTTLDGLLDLERERSVQGRNVAKALWGGGHGGAMVREPHLREHALWH